MKYIIWNFVSIAIGFSLILPISSFAQNRTEEIVVPLSEVGSRGKLEVHIHRGRVTIEGSNRTEDVLVEVSSEDKDRQAQRTYPNGLKRIPNNVTNIRIEEDGNEIEIHGDHSNKVSDLFIELPSNFDLEIHTHHNGDILVSNVSGVMELNSHHGPITAKDISGAVVANTHHGAIKASFKDVNSDVPMAFSTYHGNVELKLPSNTAFSGKLQSSRGEILTDFEMTVKPDPDRVKKRNENGHFEVNLGGWVYGDVNQGGPEFMMKTYHGDIIIQKN
ncbi:MAG: hypothetical protein AAF694_10230 [Bacteroidota bacterium]